MAFEFDEIEILGFSAPIAIDHHKSPRPFIPEIISRGGGAGHEILQLFDEKHDLDASSSNSTTDSVAIGDEVDANSPSSVSIVSSNSASSPIYDPMPLRSFHPTMANKRKRGNGGGRKRGKRSSSGGGEYRRGPSIRISEFPELVRALDSRNVDVNGGGAVFLYRKTLEASDVRRGQNRLFMTESEAVVEFLTAEEAAAVEENGEGVMVLGLDEGGKPYKLRMKKWQSLNITVINSGWNKMVAANGAGKGDDVEIWGFRHGCAGKLGFAILFRKS